MPSTTPPKAASSKRRRGRPLRQERPDTLFFITSRTLNATLWLHPMVASGKEHANHQQRRVFQHYERRAERHLQRLVKRANETRGPYQPKLTLETAKRLLTGLVGSALARAQAYYNLEVFALVVMGNHFHLVARAPDKNLSLAIGYFKARISEGINLLYGRRGTLWERRFDAEPILDDQAAMDRTLYTAVNPVRAGLVDRAEQWPGLLAVGGLEPRNELTFEYLDRSAWHHEGRPDDLNPYFKTVTLRLSVLPEWAAVTGSTYPHELQGLLRDRERQARAEHGKAALGLNKLAQTNPEQQPVSSKRSPRPYCHCFCPQRREQHLAEVHALHQAYEPCSERFRLYERNTPFPEGTYPPPLLQAA